MSHKDDLPTRLAQERHSYGLMHGHKVQTCVVCEHTAAAVREALEKAELTTRCERCHDAIAALREGRDA